MSCPKKQDLSTALAAGLIGELTVFRFLQSKGYSHVMLKKTKMAEVAGMLNDFIGGSTAAEMLAQSLWRY